MMISGKCCSLLPTHAIIVSVGVCVNSARRPPRPIQCYMTPCRAQLSVAVHTVYGRVIALSFMTSFIIYYFNHANCQFATPSQHRFYSSNS